MNFSHIPLNNSTLSHSINHYKTTGTDKLNTPRLQDGASRKLQPETSSARWRLGRFVTITLGHLGRFRFHADFWLSIVKKNVKMILRSQYSQLKKIGNRFCCSAAAQPTPSAKNTVALHWALLREVWPRSRWWFSPWRSHSLSPFLKFETDINPPSLKNPQKDTKGNYINICQVTCVVVCWPFWRCRPATMTWFTLRFLSGWLWKTKMNKKHFCWKNTQNSVDYDSDICHFFWSRRCTRKLPGSTSVNTKWLREIAVQ